MHSSCASTLFVACSQHASKQLGGAGCCELVPYPVGSCCSLPAPPSAAFQHVLQQAQSKQLPVIHNPVSPCVFILTTQTRTAPKVGSRPQALAGLSGTSRCCTMGIAHSACGRSTCCASGTRNSIRSALLTSPVTIFGLRITTTSRMSR